MTTKINNEHKKLNAPNLRFPEFLGEWEKCKLGNIANITGGYAFKSDTLNSIGGKYQVVKMGNLYQNQLDLHRSPSYTNILTSKAENVILRKGDIAITLTGTNNKRDFGYTYIFNDEKNLLLNQRCGLIRTKGDPYFLSCLLKTYAFLNQFFESATGGTGNQANVSTKAMEMFSVNTPSLKEQKKIGELMALLDERIATQNKIIDRLQSLIKGIAQHCIKDFTNGCEYVRLGDICKITTGKLDANAQVENGQYPFFTCAERPFYIDNYAFDTEALLISGNGANLGYINYYKGKFNAYQRTYVLDHFSVNIQYVKWALKVLLPQRIAIEKSSSNTPYIVLSTLADLKIPIPNNSKQNHIADLMMSFERKLSTQLAMSDLYNKQKQYLLRQMFI